MVLFRVCMSIPISILLACPISGADADKFLTNDAEVVAFINVRRVLDSDLVKNSLLEELKRALKRSGSAHEIFTAGGIDPFKDVASVTFCGPARFAFPPRGLTIVRGSFDLDAVHA